jgi:hypothetical protein
MVSERTKFKSLILTDWHVRAALDGRLAQIRVPLKRQPSEGWEPYSYGEVHKTHNGGFPLRNGLPIVVGWGASNRDGDESHVTPWRPGDVLAVKETYDTSSLTKYHDTGDPDDHGGPNDPCCAYAATATYKCGKRVPDIAMVAGFYKWKSPATMPPWASRLFLTVTAVRVARCRDVTEADAVACGCIADRMSPDGTAAGDFKARWADRYGPESRGRDEWVAVGTVEAKRA